MVLLPTLKLQIMLTKDILRDQIEKLPEQFSVDQLIERLILVDKIEKGIKDSNEGNVFTEAELDAELQKWFQE